MKRLRELGIDVVIHDPYVDEYKGDLLSSAANTDAVVVMVAHHDYKQVELSKISSVMRTPILVDGRAVYTKAQAELAGFEYRGVGKGIKLNLGSNHV